MIEFLPEARSELLAARARYDGESSALGDDFEAEFFDALDLAVAAPRQSPEWFAGMRWRQLPRFPYFFVFEATPIRFRVLAVVHAGRSPGYWLHRRHSRP